MFIPFLPSDPSPHDGKGRIRSPADRARAFYKGAAGGGGGGGGVGQGWGQLAGGVGGQGALSGWAGWGRTESAARKAEELSALCTWMNNREFPAWVRPIIIINILFIKP